MHVRRSGIARRAESRVHTTCFLNMFKLSVAEFMLLISSKQMWVQEKAEIQLT